MNSIVRPERGLELAEQPHDLRLHRDVERRDRLVADDELRSHDQRARDADALPLPARELVRVARGVAALEADAREPVADALANLRRRRCLPFRRSPSPMISPTVMRGFRLEYGS